MELRELVQQLISLSVIHRCRITKNASSVGLYWGQPMILEYVLEHDTCTQAEIARALYISPPSVATSLKRIEKAGLITRRQDERDPRKNHISITESGKNALTEFRKICDSTDADMFKGFSEEEKEALHALLLRLHENLDSKSFSREEIRQLINTTKGEND